MTDGIWCICLAKRKSLQIVRLLAPRDVRVREMQPLVRR